MELIKYIKTYAGKLDDNVDQRTGKALKNISLSLVTKGFTMVIAIAFVPLLVHQLTTEKYGVWLTLTSILTLLSFSDVGLGHGLKNLLAEFLANEDYISARKVVSTAYLSLTVIALTLFTTFLCINPFIKWDRVLNASSGMSGELSVLILFVIAFFCIQLVLNLITSVFEAFQMSSYSSVVYMLGQILAFTSVFLISRITKETSLVPYGIAISLAPIFILSIFSLIFFSCKYKHIVPSIKYFDKIYLKRLYFIGGKFFLIQLTAILLYQSNNLIIAHTVGPNDVAVYNIAYRYAGIIQMLFTIILSPVWVASTDAFVKKDFLWIKKTIKHLNHLFILAVLVIIIQLIFTDKIYELWLGASIKIDFIITALLMLYFIFSMRNGIYCSVINGTGKIYFQFVITLVEVLIHIPLSIFFGLLWGTPGVLISMCLVAFCNTIWMPIQCNKLLNQTAKGIFNK